MCSPQGERLKIIMRLFLKLAVTVGSLCIAASITACTFPHSANRPPTQTQPTQTHQAKVEPSEVPEAPQAPETPQVPEAPQAPKKAAINRTYKVHFVGGCKASGEDIDEEEDLDSIDGVQSGHRIAIYTCDNIKVKIANDHLSVNGRSYGALKPGDTVTCDHGKVLIRGKVVTPSP